MIAKCVCNWYNVGRKIRRAACRARIRRRCNMKTTAVRLYGKRDLRLETFELPPLGDGDILARVVSDSVCMSTYKAASQGENHKRVPNDVHDNPIIVGHEFCGEILEVGARWQDEFKPGQRLSIQPALNDPDDPFSTPGYAFKYLGGDATYVVIPSRVMELGCLLPFNGDAFYYGSLAEPVSCIIGGFHVNYHTTPGVYQHDMGIREGGNLAILAGVGPMGLGAIDYALHCDRRPALVTVTDIDADRLARAEKLFPVDAAAQLGIKLTYVNTATQPDSTQFMLDLTGGKGYDDVYVFAPVAPVVEQGAALLGFDGCLNFFAGPTNTAFSAQFNFYNVHYMLTHVAGNSGGNTDDMREALKLAEQGRINPSTMITHVGGLDAVIDTTLNLPNIKGGKKLIYTHISMPLTALDDLERLGESDPMLRELAAIVARHNGLWSPEAENFLLQHAPRID